MNSLILVSFYVCFGAGSYHFLSAEPWLLTETPNAYYRPEVAVPVKKKAAYLGRHKLLTDAERESLNDYAFAPVRYVPD